MKRLIFLTCLFSMFNLASNAQTNPTPWDLKNGNYIFTNYLSNPISTTYPPSINVWSGPYNMTQPTAPIAEQATGDEPICGICGSTESAITNAGINGIGIHRSNAAPINGAPLGIVLGINTTDCFGVRVAWFADVIGYNNDFPAGTIQMQYRVGTTGNWNNIENNEYETNIVDYLATSNKSLVALLPEDANDKPEIQLRWVYFNKTNISNGNALGISKLWVAPDSIAGQTWPGNYIPAMGDADCSGADPHSFIPGFNPLYIERIVVLNSSLDNTSACPLNEGYSDYTNIVTDVETGLSYPLEVYNGPGFMNNLERVVVWVDWNQDDDFDDADEVIYVVSTQFSIFQEGLIHVPITALSGLTRMRVRVSRALDYTSYGPTPDGEVEDYTLNVINSLQLTPGCSDLALPIDEKTDVCTGSQMFTWNKASKNPDGYAFYLGTDNPPTTIHDSTDVGIDTTFVNTTPLIANTIYYWQVKPYNVFGKTIDCEVFQFTTAVSVNPAIDAILIDGLDVDSGAACLNTDVAILANISGGSGTVNFDWTGDDTYLDDNSINAPVFTGTIDDKEYVLRLTVEDDNKCAARDSIKIYVKKAPTGGTLTSDKTSVCPGEDVNLSITGYDHVIQDWEKAVNGAAYASIGHTGTTLMNTINDETKYQVMIEKNGCTIPSNEVAIALKSMPTIPTIAVSPSNTVCEGAIVTLTATPATNIVWNDAGNSSTSTLSVTSNGTFHVTYTDPVSGCLAISSDEKISFNNKPSTPVIAQKGDSLVTKPLQVVDWLDADENVVATGESFRPTKTSGQTFTAVVVDGNDCESDESNVVNYDHTVSVLSYTKQAFSVFPNPVNQELNIMVHAASSAGMFQLKDMTGRIIKHMELTEGKSVVSLSDVESGVYLLQHESGSSVRIVKQ